MKKLLTILLLTLSFNSYSQYGISGSLGSSKLSSDTDNYTPELSLQLGAYRDFVLTESVLLRTKGSLGFFNTSLENSTSKFTGRYFLLSPEFIVKTSTKFSMVFGGALGINPKLEATVNGTKFDVESIGMEAENNLFLAKVGFLYDMGDFELQFLIDRSINSVIKNQSVKLTNISIGLNYNF